MSRKNFACHTVIVFGTLFKTSFRVINILSELKNERHKLETVYFIFKPVLIGFLKIIGVHNILHDYLILI
jgi:hypothetical protein